jgi:hypothetical protein
VVVDTKPSGQEATGLITKSEKRIAQAGLEPEIKRLYPRSLPDAPMLSIAWILAPHTGYVSNFRSPNRTVIEPVYGHCFQSDPCELLAGVHGGRPVRTRLELAKGTRNFRMRRYPAAKREVSPTRGDQPLAIADEVRSAAPADHGIYRTGQTRARRLGRRPLRPDDSHR